MTGNGHVTVPDADGNDDPVIRDGHITSDDGTDPAAVRNRIRNHAGELIATDGMTWNMTTLARMAGVSRGYLYRHFVNKADVIGHVFDRTVTREDIRLLRSIQWTAAWRPTSVRDWSEVHALLTRGSLPR